MTELDDIAVDRTVESRYHAVIEASEIFRELAIYGLDEFAILEILSSRTSKPHNMELMSEAIMLTANYMNIEVRVILGYITERYMDCDDKYMVKMMQQNLSDEVKSIFRYEMSKIYAGIEIDEFVVDESEQNVIYETD